MFSSLLLCSVVIWRLWRGSGGNVQLA